jgi:hypothetical protein
MVSKVESNELSRRSNHGEIAVKSKILQSVFLCLL